MAYAARRLVVREIIVDAIAINRVLIIHLVKRVLDRRS